MANLTYDFEIREIELDEKYDDVRMVEENLPHYDDISKTMIRVWNEVSDIVINNFEGKAHGNIQKCGLSVYRDKNNRVHGRITVQPVPGFRWNEAARDAVFDELDGQLLDGYGETMDRHPIDNVEEKYRICI